MNSPYERSRQYSEERLGKIREALGELPLENVVVAACGSYARREASRQSDIDYFIVSNSSRVDKVLKEQVHNAIVEIVPNTPAEGGPFAKWTTQRSILKNIGGANDSNTNITQGILLLLEGEWLFNECGLRNFRRKILECYIRNNMTDHQLALFLLNDIIRYYRTVAVDYEFKISKGGESKPWAIRNVKLVFSRKLLYASGLFSIAMTADRAREEKVSVLEDLFAQPVVERMKCICGECRMHKVLTSYNRFLETLENARSRRHLEGLDGRGRSDRQFREIKNEGHHFTRELLRLFEGTFDSTHPIHRAVVF